MDKLPKEPRIVGEVEKCLRNAGFWITRRQWLKNGDCLLTFKGVESPFACFSLSHALLMESRMIEADAEAFAVSVRELDTYIQNTREQWAPHARALLN